MSKVVATTYATGFAVAAMFTFGAVTALIAGLGPRSFSDWLSLIAFSGIPLEALLFAAIRGEWKQERVSASALSFVIVAVGLMLVVGFLAHAEYAAAVASALQIAVCLCGYVFLSRRERVRSVAA